MQKLQTNIAIQKIQNGEAFEAFVNDSFYLKIDEYVPYVCAAIHNGHEFREDLTLKCRLSEKERLYEEDPFTGDFISSLPITIIGNDSRFEYDLNRDPESCVYETAWGKEVWTEAFSERDTVLSKAKHQAFYEVINALILRLENQFEEVVVYDIHSYNYKRHPESFFFNIGVENVDVKRFNKQISFWKNELSKIKLKKLTVDLSVNHIFYGRGYFLKYISENFNNTLVLATEVKKMFMNETDGKPFPLVINELCVGIKDAITNSSKFFSNTYSNINVKKKNTLLSQGISPQLQKIDRALYRKVKNFEVLSFVNPTNIESEKRKFFKSNFRLNPEFKYRPLTIDPHRFKAEMYSLDIDSIDDIHFRQMYSDIISAYCDKVDLLKSLGTDKFLYNSLRYFGEPSKNDLSNAQFLLYCTDLESRLPEKELDFEFVKHRFIAETEKYGAQFKIEISNSIPSDALVINSKKKVVLKKGAQFTATRLNALINHEIGVHVTTSINAANQPLKFLSLGLPKNTYTQEGLAIYAEFQCGGLTIERLKELGLRVLAIESMVSGNDFQTTFSYLYETFNWDPNKLFYLVTRVYRGGGFTKDYLYLRGFRKVLQMKEKGKRLDNLFLGKTSHNYLGILNEMVDRKILNPPEFGVRILSDEIKSKEILKYLSNCIKN